MTDARTEVLSRIKLALTPSVGPAARKPRPAATSAYFGADHEWETATSGEALLALLTERIVDYRASVTRVGPDGVAEVVGRLLAGVERAVVPSGLDRSWLAVAAAAGTEVVADDPARALSTAELDAVDAAVTASCLAVAETGTIVLDSSPDQGRRALSLVPDHHVCIVRAEDVVRGLPAAMARLDIARPITWISGPSATSDIELKRVEGVHGPRRLDVVLVVAGGEAAAGA